MFDRSTVQERLKKLEEQLILLREVQQVGKEKFLADPREHVYALHLLQTAIQAMIDIGTHLISGLNLGRVETYRDIARLLSQRGIIPEEFRPKFESMIGLRNLIIHEYLKIEFEKIYTILQDNLEDLTEFAKHIQGFLTQNDGGGG